MAVSLAEIHPKPLPTLASLITSVSRIHVDHAQFGKHMLLVTIDTYLKWPEVQVVSSTSAQPTFDKLRMIFATHGFPMTLVSDSGPLFQFAGFHSFMLGNGIVHSNVPPYHPSSNGLVENKPFIRVSLSEMLTLRHILLVTWFSTAILVTAPQ